MESIPYMVASMFLLAIFVIASVIFIVIGILMFILGKGWKRKVGVVLMVLPVIAALVIVTTVGSIIGSAPTPMSLEEIYTEKRAKFTNFFGVDCPSDVTGITHLDIRRGGPRSVIYGDFYCDRETIFKIAAEGQLRLTQIARSRFLKLTNNLFLPRGRLRHGSLTGMLKSTIWFKGIVSGIHGKSLGGCDQEEIVLSYDDNTREAIYHWRCLSR